MGRRKRPLKLAFVVLERCDGARVGPERDADQRRASEGGDLDVRRRSPELAETPGPLRQGPQGPRCRCEAPEETGFSGRIGDQKQEGDGRCQAKTGSAEEALGSAAF